MNGECRRNCVLEHLKKDKGAGIRLSVGRAVFCQPPGHCAGYCADTTKEEA